MGISQQDIFAIKSPSAPPPTPKAPGPPDTPERLETIDPEPTTALVPAGSRRKLMVAAGGAGLLAIAAIVYAVMLRGERDDAESRASALADDNRDLADALALHRAGSIELGGKLEECGKDLKVKTIAAETTGARVSELETELATTRGAVASLEEKETELKAVTHQFQKMIDSGKLDVMFRRGQLIVKLPARILFASGSADVSESGAAALAEVGAVLKTMRRKFTVAGHTDNIPISRPFKNNWELSAARAVSVVAVLTSAGVPPSSLVAAGFGPYAPLATNRTAKGRQTNRRIEIILEPDLTPAVKAVNSKN